MAHDRWLWLKLIKTLCAAIIVKKQNISAAASVGLALIEDSMAKLAIIYLRIELMIVIILDINLKFIELYGLSSAREIEYCLSRTTVIFISERHAVECFFQKNKTISTHCNSL
jgi:hypothetical protein